MNTTATATTCTATRHGTKSAYEKAGCRCPDAITARSAYQKAQRRDLRQGRSRRLPAVGYRRRLQALAAIGWPIPHLAAELGAAESAVFKLTADNPRQDWVWRTTADAIVALYDRLSMKPGPSAVARENAAARGWVSALAWDDDEIDDPNAKPRTGGKRLAGFVDHAAVIRRIHGDRSIRINRNEATEVVIQLRRQGYADNEIARHTGLKVERYVPLQRDLRVAS